MTTPLHICGSPAVNPGKATGCAAGPCPDPGLKMADSPTSCCGRCKTARIITSLWRGGMHAFERQDVALAETMQRQALGMLKELGGMAVVEARIRNNLGVIFSCTGRAGEAEQEFAAALRLLEGRVDPSTRFHQVIAGNHAKAAAGFSGECRQDARAA